MENFQNCMQEACSSSFPIASTPSFQLMGLPSFQPGLLMDENAPQTSYSIIPEEVPEEQIVELAPLEQNILSNDTTEITENIDQTYPVLNELPEPAVQQAPESKKKKTIRHKRNINFSYPSGVRRNIDKHIVRFIGIHLAELKSQILEEFIHFKQDPQEFSQSESLFAKMREIDLNDDKDDKKSKKIKKDYAKVINIMLEKPSSMIIMKHCIELKLTHLHDGRSEGRLTPKNREIYTTTLNEYKGYINRQLSLLLAN
jgi:hypothetical protein